MATALSLRAAKSAVAQAEQALGNWKLPTDATEADRAVAERLMAPCVANLKAARRHLTLLKVQAAAVDTPLRVAAAYRRRFTASRSLMIQKKPDGLVRVSDPNRGGWMDFDISGWRIRAVAWNAPSPKST